MQRAAEELGRSLFFELDVELVSRRISFDLFEVAVEYDASPVEDGDVLTEFFYVSHLMARKEDDFVLRHLLFDNVFEQLGVDRVEAGKRLVKD